MKNNQPCRSSQGSGQLWQQKSIDRTYCRPSQQKVHADIHLVVGGFVGATENSILNLQ
jgi:hypothetical protein